MTEKTRIKLDSVISKFLDEYRDLYRELVEYVVSLGYSAKVNAKETYADFVKSKHGKTIMKIECGYENPAIPRLSIRFDALSVCSGNFQKAIERFIEGCPNCRKCNGRFGNRYLLSDGREVFPCRATIYMPSFGLLEVKEALKLQDDFLMKPMEVV